MQNKTLKEKAFYGLGWSAADKFFQQAFVFVSGVFLARMLGNQVYGLIGVLAIFTGMANLLQDSGFSSALIRKKEVSESDYTTVFYTNIFIGSVLYVILFFAAPLISNYYGEETLTPLARFLFLSFLFNSFASIQNVILIKNINYKLATKINISSVFISYSISLTLAYFGFGVWALASQIVAYAFFRSILLWSLGKWKPTGTFSFSTLKEFFSFGSKLVAGGLLNSFFTNIPQNVIGKQYSIGVTGLYNQANKLFNTVSDFLSGTVQSVPFAVLSQIHDEARLKNATRKFIRTKAFIVFPVFMGMALVAKPFILSLLGNQWADSVPILQLLCLGGVFSSLDASNNDVLRIKGKTGRILIFEVFRNCLMFLVIVITILFKINYLYMIAAISGTYFIKYIVTSYVSNKIINYTLLELVKDIFPYFLIATISIFCGYLLNYIIENQLLLIVSQIFLVSAIYFGSLYVFGSVILKEAIKIVKSNFLKL